MKSQIVTTDTPPRGHIRVSELRLRIPRRDGSGTFEIPKHELRWAREFVDVETGEVYDLGYVANALTEQGWDIHELQRGSMIFGPTVERLPLPYGGQFRPGSPTRRDA